MVSKRWIPLLLSLICVWMYVDIRCESHDWYQIFARSVLSMQIPILLRPVAQAEDQWYEFPPVFYTFSDFISFFLDAQKYIPHFTWVQIHFKSLVPWQYFISWVGVIPSKSWYFFTLFQRSGETSITSPFKGTQKWSNRAETQGKEFL